MNKTCFDCENFSSGWCGAFDIYVTADEYRSDFYYGISADARNCGGFRDSSRSSSSNSSGCFLTSACVSYMGKSDDCYELTTLRAFRDGYMKSTENGNALIKEYYEIAPQIVEKINASEMKDSYYADIYNVVSECVNHIQNREYECAIEKYRDMVTGLRKALEPF